jgi:hypothetical protein
MHHRRTNNFLKQVSWILHEQASKFYKHTPKLVIICKFECTLAQDWIFLSCFRMSNVNWHYTYVHWLFFLQVAVVLQRNTMTQKEPTCPKRWSVWKTKSRHNWPGVIWMTLNPNII